MMKGKGRILGVDYGTKRVGVSVSDPLRIISQGVGTLHNDESLLDHLCEIIVDQDIVQIIVGMPYDSDGGKRGKAIEVEEFIARFKKASPVPIDTWDESYSSVNAMQEFIDGVMKKKKRRQKSRVDTMAARLMLQEFLDSHTGG